MLTTLSQLRKACSPIFVILDPNSTDVIAVQSMKALAPMVLTFSGNLTSVRFLQPANAHSPIAVRFSGSVMEASAVQPVYLEVVDYQLFVVNTVEKWIGFYL